MIAAVVLAAGEGRRYGGLKQLHPVAGAPMLDGVLDAVERSGIAERVVVLGARAGDVLAAVDLHGARPVICETWREGQSASLRAGVEALGDVDAAVVVLGDQPRITKAAVAAVAAADGTARASYGGRPGHPIRLDRALLRRAGELRGDVGFRDILARAEVRAVEVGALADPADVDTREELANL